MARRAHANGVRIWALTDHDSVEGWPEGQRAATSLGLRFIPGIEMTCEPAVEPQDAILRIPRPEAALIMASARLLP